MALVDHLVFKRGVFLQARPAHYRLDALAAEAPHQVVVQSDVEPRLAGVALASGTPAELVIDAPGLVLLGAENEEASLIDDLLMVALPLLLREVVDEVRVPAEYDVSAATGHIGGYGYGPGAARLCDDVRLALVLLGVEDGVLDLAPVEHLADDLGLGDVGSADQDRLASLVPGLDLVDDRIVLGLLGLIDEVGLVVADHRYVGRNLHNV